MRVAHDTVARVDPVASAFGGQPTLTLGPGRRTLCDPYLNLFRGLIPPLGGTIDLSPILAFIVLDVRCPRMHVKR